MAEEKDEKVYSPKELGKMLERILQSHTFRMIQETYVDASGDALCEEAEGMSKSQRRKIGKAMEKCVQATEVLEENFGIVYSIFEEGVLPEDEDGEFEEEDDAEFKEEGD